MWYITILPHHIIYFPITYFVFLFWFSASEHGESYGIWSRTAFENVNSGNCSVLYLYFFGLELILSNCWMQQKLSQPSTVLLTQQTAGFRAVAGKCKWWYCSLITGWLSCLSYKKGAWSLKNYFSSVLPPSLLKTAGLSI